jgi:hypothetical protein
MPNVGEEITGAYLGYCLGCEFVSYNVPTLDKQGEVDVIGLRTGGGKSKPKVFICEVATHIRGLDYGNNYSKLRDKFSRGLSLARKAFPGHRVNLMLWCPKVRGKAKKAVDRVVRHFSKKHRRKLKLFINETYNQCIGELRDKAKNHQNEVKNSDVMRLLQILESLPSR